MCIRILARSQKALQTQGFFVFSTFLKCFGFGKKFGIFEDINKLLDFKKSRNLGIMDDSVFKISDQIKTVNEGYRHVVILGAGASKASCIDNPEKNGKQLPLMNDLPKIINLDKELLDLSPNLRNENFEKIFSTLFELEPNSERLQSIEKKIYAFFESLELPPNPTIYDYLILSLRKKDLIATFNWDPFL